MICELCHGRGHFITRDDQERIPCPECIGGISSCCEGPTPTTQDVENDMPKCGGKKKGGKKGGRGY